MRRTRLRRKKVPVFTGELPEVPDRRLLEVKELLRPDEVADILRVSRSKVYFMARSGELSGVRVSGSLRIKAESVRRLLYGEDEVR